MAEAKLKLRPFSVPNYVLADGAAVKREDGWREPPKFALDELDAETLSELCREFRAAVFKKSGKADPEPKP
jgi:hypothetical protein